MKKKYFYSFFILGMLGVGLPDAWGAQVICKKEVTEGDFNNYACPVDGVKGSTTLAGVTQYTILGWVSVESCPNGMDQVPVGGSGLTDAFFNDSNCSLSPTEQIHTL